MPYFFQLSAMMQIIATGVCSAAWSAFAPHIPLVGIFLAPFFLIPLFLVSFSQNKGAGALAAFISGCLTFLLSGPLPALAFFIIYFTLFLYLSFLFLQKDEKGIFRYSLGDILSKLSSLVLIIISAGLVILRMQNIDWQVSLEEQMSQIPLSTSDLKSLIHQLITWLPGLLGVSILGTLTLNAYIAQILLEKHQRQVRTRQALDWDSPLYWDIIFIMGLMLWLLAEFWQTHSIMVFAKAILSIACLPLIFIGFRICYLQLRQQASGKMWFFLLTIVSFLLVWPLVFIVILGLIEPWYGLTQYYASKQE